MEEIIKHVASSIPVLENSKHKGNMGRIGVLGGSKEYSGAPYFAGITALYCVRFDEMMIPFKGADLVHVFSAASAAQSIKCYSPELIVHPTLDNDVEKPTKWLERLHGLVIGPGLGMSENIPNTVEMMKACRAANKPMVIDADGIYIVAKYTDVISDEDPSDDINETARLAKALGHVTIVRKGQNDIISDGDAREYSSSISLQQHFAMPKVLPDAVEDKVIFSPALRLSSPVG
ncbi:unnamed protein product [Dibothriocephalus latus]|uniref:ATP-dependent NAD(P)H-hydrate dehydratase n=1 Tax=Dibothriocephalus latus TaxID=60516 RepID=A0A3P7LF06_DIBLA|nr:unnamed protein product [Dibothriocephalus latus]